MKNNFYAGEGAWVNAIGSFAGEVAQAVSPRAAYPVVLLCGHVGSFIPPQLAGQGPSAEAADSHAAWDQGADGIAREIPGLLGAAPVRFVREPAQCSAIARDLASWIERAVTALACVSSGESRV